MFVIIVMILGYQLIIPWPKAVFYALSWEVGTVISRYIQFGLGPLSVPAVYGRQSNALYKEMKKFA